MQRSVLVLPDGKISYPLAGQFQAAGRTPEDIQKILVKRLDRFFPDPVITVSVVNVSGAHEEAYANSLQISVKFMNNRFIVSLTTRSESAMFLSILSEIKNATYFGRRG